MTPAPTTAGQASLFFAEQKGVPGGAYNVPTVVNVRGTVETGALVDACHRLIGSTPALRVRVGIDQWNGQVVQWFSDERPQVEVVHLPAAELGRFAEELSRQPLETDEGPLTRMAVVRTAADEVSLVLITHHLVVDGMSYGTLARRIGDAVSGQLTVQSEESYLSLVHQVRRAAERSRERDRPHWESRLPAGTEMASWRSPTGAGVPDARRLVRLATAPTERLAAATVRVGMFPFLVAAVHRVQPLRGGGLSVVCAATSVRPRDGAHNDIVGCFINEIPMVTGDRATGSIAELAAREAGGWREDLRRRDYAFTTHLDRVAPGGADTARLDSVIVSYRRTPSALGWRARGLEFSTDLYPRYPTAKNEIAVRFFHYPDQLAFEVHWGRDLPAGLGECFTDDLFAALTTHVNGTDR